MAPASPISTTATLLRRSVVVSPSDRFRVPEARDRRCAARAFPVPKARQN
jgi:hypothetical protein